MDALLLAAVCGAALLVAYFTYGRWVARRVFRLREDTPTPAVLHCDHHDYCPTAKSIVFGHHFTSIAGTGPIVGPAIAVMWGWLPAVIWVVLGSIFIGAVHDLGSLVVSLRNKGRTIGDIAGDLLGPRVRLIFLGILVMGLWIVLAIFGLVIAAVLRQYPAAIFPVLFQVPLAVGIGWVVHRRGGSILWPSVAALSLMYLSVMFGDASFGPTLGGLHAFNQWLAAQPTWLWVVGLLVYSYIASVLPVWVLLQPRDYINALQLLSALGLLVVGLVVAAVFGGATDAAMAAETLAGVSGAPERPRLEIVAPLVNAHPAGAPPMIPLLFITIACGAISGFHCLVASGTTSKQLQNEKHAQAVGYGSMLTEGFLAILVIIACAAGIGLGLTKGIESTGTGMNDTYLAGHIRLPKADGNYLHAAVATRTDGRTEDFKPIGNDPSEFRVILREGHPRLYGGFGVSSTFYAHFKTEDGVREEVDYYAAGQNLRKIEVDGHVVPLDPLAWTYRVDGQLAFDSQYQSWSSAGALAATVGAFVEGSANFIESLGIPEGLAIALMGVLVASFAGTTMDTACRLQRYVIQELSRTFLPCPPEQACAHCGYDLSGLETGIDAWWTCPECGQQTPIGEAALHAEHAKPAPGAPGIHTGLDAQRALASNWNPFKWLATPHGATMFAVITAAALAAVPPPGMAISWENAGKGGQILWPLFGATNQLLGGMAFLVIGAWLIATKRPVWFIVLPTVFMVVVPAWALVWQAFVGNDGNPSWLADRKWLLVGIAAAALLLEGWLVAEVGMRLVGVRRTGASPLQQ